MLVVVVMVVMVCWYVDRPVLDISTQYHIKDHVIPAQMFGHDSVARERLETSEQQQLSEDENAR